MCETGAEGVGSRLEGLDGDVLRVACSVLTVGREENVRDGEKQDEGDDGRDYQSLSVDGSQY